MSIARPTHRIQTIHYPADTYADTKAGLTSFIKDFMPISGVEVDDKTVTKEIAAYKKAGVLKYDQKGLTRKETLKEDGVKYARLRSRAIYKDGIVKVLHKLKRV